MWPGGAGQGRDVYTRRWAWDSHSGSGLLFLASLTNRFTQYTATRILALIEKDFGTAEKEEESICPRDVNSWDKYWLTHWLNLKNTFPILKCCWCAGPFQQTQPAGTDTQIKTNTHGQSKPGLEPNPLKADQLLGELVPTFIDNKIIARRPSSTTWLRGKGPQRPREAAPSLPESAS